MDRSDILNAANNCVNGDRDHQYGIPENNFKLIAELWMAYLSNCGGDKAAPDLWIRPEDVAAMMALMKLARIATGTPKVDSWVDLAGYAACGGEIVSTKIKDVENL